MSRLNVYIDGIKIPNSHIKAIWTNDKGLLMIETIDKKSKTIVRTDASLRKIEIR